MKVESKLSHSNMNLNYPVKCKFRLAIYGILSDSEVSLTQTGVLLIDD